MKLHQILAGIAVSTLIVLGTAVTTQAEEGQEQMSVPGVSPQEFRNRLIDWALASERGKQPGDDLAVKIASLSDQQIEIWLSLIEDPDRFVASTERVVGLLKEQRAADQSELQYMESSPSSTPMGAAPPLTTLFPPDYPPGSGPYKDTVIDAIAGFGIGGASSTNRCDATDWGDYVGVWWPLNTAFDALDGACVVAGCDPTGISCFVACGILETAKVALKVAAVPLEACDVHQGAIDGAEIEAMYENTAGLVGDVAHVHDDLADHDANIDADLAAHDANIDGDLAAHDANIDGDLVAHDTDIKALLADLQGAVDENQRLIKITMSRQQEMMRLLLTPSGRRTINEDVLTCTGDDCPIYPGLQICANGSLSWNCKE